MSAFWMVYFILIGLVTSSFFSLVGLRVPQKQSILKPRSRCDSCGVTLTWKQLIPVVSYSVQKGRCASCGTRISPILPFFELLTAAVFAVTYMTFGLQWYTVIVLLFFALLHMISVSDLFFMRIPNIILLVGGGLVVIVQLFNPYMTLVSSLIGGAVGFGVLFLLMVISRGGMGAGDVKLFFFVGFVLGWGDTLLVLFLASLLGAVYGIIGRIAGRFERKQSIPFGPFISLGAVIVVLYGDILQRWYMGG
ncbi:prepilin peptidase [Aureibacillus halotolerans]|uniref:Leader peptidase (Prepilin peptidase)/N-methyltransferase n=1 Tax=Aureibacillus halotolerans TaxID=1508390 RepID=A0A4R6TXD8_9BACI|nr:A24 family peptidase [Aureibacillus halotolerans]TDQ37956.1 leader peptidase (prepilin peptidase)/N-methyltransferase [Aureibacillus halotolerans]